MMIALGDPHARFDDCHGDDERFGIPDHGDSDADDSWPERSLMPRRVRFEHMLWYLVREAARHILIDLLHSN